ncbi:MAG: hypothetical protein F6K07_32310 [Okeania sp. SIO1H5]|uniref:hypothetical protein n=1 Tax=Okeania sp. SIO1H5 TaxID=2607777 RepID=UPI0013B809F9|nr:hypothetical protein [Okeania sp. SIO1H5]NET23689.1 hypothetical protein [Okeania sp. SIO1H5]
MNAEFPNNCTLVDFHVHLYETVSFDQALDVAAKNFQKAQRGSIPHGSLFLSQLPQQSNFESWKSKNEKAFGWKLQELSEPTSVEFQKEDRRIRVISGYQVVTKEKLEVLGQGIMDCPKPGQSVEGTIQEIHDLGGIAVLPWGVGKWLGKRAAIIKRAIRNFSHTRQVFVGDNGGRPWFWKNTSLREASSILRQPILPGTDSLPILRDETRIGAFGGIVNIDLFSSTAPMKLFLEQTKKNGLRIMPYGNPATLQTFVSSQFKLRFQKQRTKN